MADKLYEEMEDEGITDIAWIEPDGSVARVHAGWNEDDAEVFEMSVAFFLAIVAAAVAVISAAVSLRCWRNVEKERSNLINMVLEHWSNDKRVEKV